MFAEFWWIIPLAMMVLCFLVMRGSGGASMCGFRSHEAGQSFNRSDTAIEILNKRYVLGEMDKEEYEDKRRSLSHPVSSQE